MFGRIAPKAETSLAITVQPDCCILCLMEPKRWPFGWCQPHPCLQWHAYASLPGTLSSCGALTRSPLPRWSRVAPRRRLVPERWLAERLGAMTAARRGGWDGPVALAWLARDFEERVVSGERAEGKGRASGQGGQVGVARGSAGVGRGKGGQRRGGQQEREGGGRGRGP